MIVKWNLKLILTVFIIFDYKYYLESQRSSQNYSLEIKLKFLIKIFQNSHYNNYTCTKNHCLCYIVREYI